MPDEATALQPSTGSETSTAIASRTPETTHNESYDTNSGTEPQRQQTAVDGNHPALRQAQWEQYQSETQERGPEPPKLTSDNRTSSAWLDWVARGLPAQPEAEPAPVDDLAEYARYGKDHAANRESLAVLSDLLNPKSEHGPKNFLISLQRSAPQIFEKLQDVLIDSDRNYAVERLMLNGALPSALYLGPRELPHEDLMLVPQVYHQTLQSLPPAVYEHVMQMRPSEREFFLKTEADLQHRYAQMSQQQQAHYQSALVEAVNNGRKEAQALSQIYEREHYAWLEKNCRLFDKSANTVVHQALIESAFAVVLGQPRFVEIYNVAHELLAKAFVWDMHGDRQRANDALQTARQLAAQFNSRLGQEIRNRTKELEQAINARVGKEVEKIVAELAQPKGAATAAGIDMTGAPPTLKNGKTNPEFIEFLASRLPKGATANA
jgi:hypothetical protein